MSVLLIRHEQTAGNLQGRYIGCRTEEDLLPASIVRLKTAAYPPVQRLYCSPMRRCLQTAQAIYPRLQPIIINDFRECDFGLFEGKNYAELNGDPQYQAWIDSGGTLPFSQGESQAEFSARCVRAYEKLLPDLQGVDAALIVHGGTVMAIMAAFALPKRDYFSYQVANGQGFCLNPDGSWHAL